MHVTLFTVVALLGLTTTAVILPERDDATNTNVCIGDAKPRCCDINRSGDIVACEYPGAKASKSIKAFERACYKKHKEPKCCSSVTQSTTGSAVDFVAGGNSMENDCEDV